ncbi:TolC family protein [Bdellovibrio sp. HCB337]|uniref:TolC family protein n=1 Tax=Bdellovibrio sp. HCB337 TaxID=3394358 RepID=UPI0039A5D36A
MVRRLLLLLLLSSQVQAAPADLTCKPNITLSQKDVAELILKQGRRTQEINLQYQQLRLSVAQSLAAYQWNLTASTGYLFDKSVGLQSSTFDKTENLVSQVLLSKSFTTGTTASVEYKRSSFKGDPNANTGGTPRTVATQDLLGLNIYQNIWANFFGIADRGETDAAELNYKSTAILRTNELENTVLDAIRAFWTAYVSEQNFKEAVASRDRSKKLMDAVKKKSGFGYANPGELSQAQAEYEVRVQDVKTFSTAYLRDLDTLNTLLTLPVNCDVKFSVSNVIPTLPQLPEKSVQDLRIIRSEKLRVQAAERAYDAAKSRDAPTLQLVGKIYSYGVEDDGSGAYSDMVSGAHPQYYAGLQFQYLFGVDLLSETRLNRKYAKELEEVRLSRVTQESEDLQAQAQRRVQTTYSAVLSAVEEKKFREKALQELTRSFNQGRTDINIYIDAMNKYSASEIRHSLAIGNYQTALNEWAATRDELIPDAQEE